MPIYAPTLPPRPSLNQGTHPILVLLRFDLRRTLRQKLGLFFLFGFGLILLIQLAVLYFSHLVNTSGQLAGVRDFAKAILPQGAEFQADRLPEWLLWLLWFQVALIGGGLVARDTLYRIRPLIYAHPVRPLDYLLSKGVFSVALPFAVQLPFVLLPWAVSLLIAGQSGPIWPTAPLYLLPAVLAIALLMGAVSLGASSFANTPKAGIGWVLGILFGTGAVGAILAGVLNNPDYLAISPIPLTAAWPRLCCGVAAPPLHWGPVVAGTLGHILLWTWLGWARTKPSEAVI